MHLRYDFKNKPDLSNFKTQSKFFLKKEDCVFSFYLEDFAVTFDVSKILDMGSGELDIPPKMIYKIVISILDILKKENSTEVNSVNVLTDLRFKDIKFIQDLFNGSNLVSEKESVEESLTFIELMLNYVKKIKKMSALA